MSSGQALTKRSRDAELMPPPPLPKRIKRPPKVLDEDTYTNALSHIIARDFFPGLLESQTQQEYLDALEAQDHEWIVEAGSRLRAAMTPGPDGRRIRGRRGTSMTPSPMLGTAGETPKGWAGATPISVAASDTTTMTASMSKDGTPEVDLNMSLTGFQAKYTSEDNESFNALLDKQNAKRREKQRWLWAGNNIPSGSQIAYRARQQKLVEASSGEGDRNKQVVLRPSSPDSRPAMAEHRPSQPRNALMFTPDSIEDTHQTVFQASEAASNAPPRSVNYDNTRLPAPSQHSQDTIPPSPSMSAIDAAIAGRPRPTDSEPGYSGAETPRVHGYAFVDAEPTPAELGYAEETSEADTTLLMGFAPTDSTPNPFNIQQASKREVLHHRMVEKTAKAKRAAPGNRLAQLQGGTPVGRTPTPSFPSSPQMRRGENLTPAGEKLLSRLGTPKREGGFNETTLNRDGGLRRGWTPTAKAVRQV